MIQRLKVRYILYKCVFFKLDKKLHEYFCVCNIMLTFKHLILQSNTFYRMEIRFSSSPPNRGQPVTILPELLLHPDGIEAKLHEGEHLHPVVGHQGLGQIKHPSTPSLAPSSIVPP